MSDYAVLDQPHKIYGVGAHILEGIGTGTIYGTVLDIDNRQVLLNVSVFVTWPWTEPLVCSGVFEQGCRHHLRSRSAANGG